MMTAVMINKKINKKRLCCVLMSAGVAFYGAIALHGHLITKSELRKYELSERIAANFYNTLSWEADISDKELSDAWGRPFEITVTPFEKQVRFVSKGSNPKSDDDDLIVEMSSLSYYHRFLFGNVLSEVSENYD